MNALSKKRQKWIDEIAAWSASGLSQAEYCRRQGIELKRFYWWKSKLFSAKSGTKSGASTPGEFVTLTTSSLPVTTESIQLRLGEIEIDYRHDTDPALLLNLIQLLGERV